MTYDFAMLGLNESPEREVGLSLPLHDKLMSAACNLGPATLLQRASDYFQDADYSVSELPGLLAELVHIQSACDDQLQPVLDKLVKLVREAIAHGKVVSGLAD